ncbi:unnamed protein product [Linum trigynum]|uniref:Uncharacterized protein n=1 Tax=Linum trigynum TaxID=586398 RepID=A0AAV2FFY2_9ROSI
MRHRTVVRHSAYSGPPGNVGRGPSLLSGVGPVLGVDDEKQRCWEDDEGRTTPTYWEICWDDDEGRKPPIKTVGMMPEVRGRKAIEREI